MFQLVSMSRAAAVVVSCGIISGGFVAPASAGNTFQTTGDVLQFVLPGVAAVCAIRQSDFRPYATRLVGQAVVTQGLKYGLGNSAINQRPNGESHGFPSGHTAAAFYGASYLAHNCLQNQAQKVVAYGLAVAVGASRIDSNQHNAGQVIAGALVGYFFDTVSVSITDHRLKIGKRYAF